ncbi:MAG: hypothetical protein H0X30_15705 [Anaerolineae bacterium]|nr:hypothetical protein [Anaerolineae bacterium]
MTFPTNNRFSRVSSLNASQWLMPRLPVNDIDVLIIDRLDDATASEGFIDASVLKPLNFENGALIESGDLKE